MGGIELSSRIHGWTSEPWHTDGSRPSIYRRGRTLGYNQPFRDVPTVGLSEREAGAGKAMGTIVKVEDGAETIEVDLRNPWLAAALSWFIPGAGQLYQRRFAKGTVFLVTVLGTFFYGMYLSNGRAVYASFRSEDVRLWYVPQLLAGGVALPAAVQYSLASKGQAPILGGFEAPPDGEVLLEWASEGYDPPGEPISPETYKKRLGQWIADPDGDFNLGTLFTVIAGLINVYVIYDAFAGPLPEKRREDDDPKPDEAGGNGPATAGSPGS